MANSPFPLATIIGLDDSTGTFSDNGNTVTDRWEASGDGSNWEPDFDLTYTKVK